MANAAVDVYHKGFALAWDDESEEYAISLEGELVSRAKHIEIAKQCIDFFHDASSASFKLHRKRAEQVRQERRESPEPELRKEGRMNVAWVKWYRDVTGCGLRAAHDEAVRRMNATD